MLRKVLLALALISFVLAYSLPEAKSHFESFKLTHNKQYESIEEENFRFQVFYQNMKEIKLMNEKSKGAQFGITKFADMTKREFQETILMKNKITPSHQRNHDDFVAPSVNDLPDQLDWRLKGAVTPVKDQGQCGSCWAFSVVETVESQWILAGKSTAQSLRLSEQQVVDCDRVDAGCNGGDPPSAYEYILDAKGLQNDTTYPYTARDGHCAFNPNKVVSKISSWKYASQTRDEKTLQQNLATYGPLSICVDASYWQHYTGGVMTAWECAWINQLNHCVQLVGYDTSGSKPAWIVRNSWGTSWGINGYIHLSMWENTCGLTEEATVPVV